MPFDTTEQTEEKGLITGRRNAAFLRNKYQKILNKSWEEVKKMMLTNYAWEMNKRIDEKSFLYWLFSIFYFLERL